MPHFVKSHGLGNDYIVIDPRDIPFTLTPEATRIICDRHRGVGSDGILLVGPSDGDVFGVRIFNPDGSEAEKSGNGARIFAKYVREHGHTERERFVLRTAGGDVPVRLEMREGRVAFVSAEMGTPRFDALDRIEVDGRVIEITSLSLGNPHCVVLVPDLADVDVQALGPKIERHPAFPAHTNVQFAQVAGRAEVQLEIWERGAGYTLASGSSACAAVAAAHRKGLVDRAVTVVMPGGKLEIAVADDGGMRMRGPVEEVMAGDFSPDLLARLQAR